MNKELNTYTADDLIRDCMSTAKVAYYAKSETASAYTTEEICAAYVVSSINDNYENNGGELDYLDCNLHELYLGSLEEEGVEVNYVKVEDLINAWLND